MSGTRTVHLIEDDMIQILKSPDLHPDLTIALAAVLFADAEGIARMPQGQLRRWCARPGQNGRKASDWFIRSRIDGLIETGVLAEGSTPTELRSMVAYGTEAESGEAGGR
ncbi:hypothetical protein ACT3TE_03135 [Brachybacterium sp. AOP42-B2-9]|uniref:hypothetical protein n=1 Tax=Brachybacterium sp. AOP42-B2-9 TaxID=3457672 RepID=UPI0040345C9F